MGCKQACGGNKSIFDAATNTGAGGGGGQEEEEADLGGGVACSGDASSGHGSTSSSPARVGGWGGAVSGEGVSWGDGCNGGKSGVTWPGTNLTTDQRDMIARKRQEALALRARRAGQ